MKAADDMDVSLIGMLYFLGTHIAVMGFHHQVPQCRDWSEDRIIVRDGVIGSCLGRRSEVVKPRERLFREHVASLNRKGR